MILFEIRKHEKNISEIFFTIILSHSSAFIYACDNEDSEYSKTFTQKRKSNHQDDLRVSKKFKVEVTQSSDLNKELVKNINSPFPSNFSESVDLVPLACATSEIENNVKALNFIKNGLVKVNLDGHEAAVLDYEQVFEMTGISNELKASAYINHGFVKIHLGQYKAAILDYNHCLLLSEISDNIKIIAYSNRSYAKATLGHTGEAILDLEEILIFKDFFSSQGLLLIYDGLIQLYEKQLNKKKISLNLNIKKNSNFIWIDS